MEDKIKDYAFYVISKEFDFLKSDGYTFGVLRNNTCFDHEHYFNRLKEINPYVFENIANSDWPTQCEELATQGNIVIANTALEIEELKNRLYGLYLPTFPTMFQIKNLSQLLPQLEVIPLDISLLGILSSDFFQYRLSNEYNSYSFLQFYLQINTKLLKEENVQQSSTLYLKKYKKFYSRQKESNPNTY